MVQLCFEDKIGCGPADWAESSLCGLEEDRKPDEEGQDQLSIIMEEIKAQTERRKQRSQALEKTARLKKKREISEKKEQKAEVKRKIEESSRRENRKIILNEDSLPILPPDDKFRCSSCTEEYKWWRGWVCLDEKKHLKN